MFGKLAKYCWVCFFVALFAAPAFPAGTDLSRQRQSFLEAEEALAKGQREVYQEIREALKDYPLYPYLVFADIKEGISLAREEEILSFITGYKSTPLAQRLRQLWLTYLAEEHQWEKLVRDYRAPVPQAVQCAYGRALLETGRTGQAWVQAERLWLHGRQRPAQCEHVFEAWRESDKLTPDLVRKRMELAFAQDQSGLANDLRNYLPEREKPWADLWLALMQRPAMVLEVDWSAVDHPWAENMLAYGMGKLIRQDTPNAAREWDHLKQTMDFSGMDTSRIEQDIALYLALRRHPEALERMEGLPDPVMMNRGPRTWGVRAALYLQDWNAVLAAWKRLDDAQKTMPRWIYWRARALEKTGLVAEAAALYREIAGGRNYFSFLAADRLNEPYRIGHRALSARDEAVQALLREPGILRAHELFFLERAPDARREWAAALSGKDASGMRAAAVLARDLSWHDRAIAAAAAAGENDDLVFGFPLAYSHLVSLYCDTRRLDPAWVFALIRQESMFMADVGSTAGALGLMQIMPATGKRIASLLAEPFPHRFVLLSPEENIRYGTFYLQMRWQELQRNPVLATAAYNAGASRVLSWLPKEGSLPADVWVEVIPFYETRDYVEKIFAYQIVYRHRLGMESAKLSAMMPDVTAKQDAGAAVGNRIDAPSAAFPAVAAEP